MTASNNKVNYKTNNKIELMVTNRNEDTKDSPKKIPIWLDCDPGHDDAVAILLGCFHPSFHLCGISASYGNAPPEKTAYNALSLITAMGKAAEVPVFAGAQHPWVRRPIYAPDIHGESGLDGTSLLPKPKCALNKKNTYLDAMEEAILSNSGEISLVSTGSLTSVATLLREKPYLGQHIAYISIMGGGILEGNRNENNSAEFNIWIDPQAANSLFKDPEIKDKCILIPLDLTHKAIATKEVEARILGDGKSNLRKLFYELFLFFGHTYKDIQDFELGPPVHDPLTLMPLLVLYGLESPENLQFRYKRLDLNVIEDEQSPNLGRTEVLREYDDNSDCGIIVGFDLKMEYFWRQVYDALHEAELVSSI